MYIIIYRNIRTYNFIYSLTILSIRNINVTSIILALGALIFCTFHTNDILHKYKSCFL